jgi:hypothetical protein
MGTKILRLAATALFIACLASTALGDTVVMRDGTRVSGTFLKGSTRSITVLDDNNQQRTLDIRDVRSIEFSPAAPDAPPPAPAAPPAAPQYRKFEHDSGQAGRTNSSPAEIVASGTQMVVRTNEPINSSMSEPGRTYEAEIEQDVPNASGLVAIPRGSPARLIVRKATQGGATSSGDLILDLYAVAIAGKEYLVSTADIEQGGRAGLGKNSRTGAMVGGGAVLGTLLGAIAGGGKGAAIGAIAGAGAGAGVQVLTRGKEVKVPAETVLTFQLDQPLRLDRN